jgi:hypothetical protein
MYAHLLSPERVICPAQLILLDLVPHYTITIIIIKINLSILVFTLIQSALQYSLISLLCLPIKNLNLYQMYVYFELNISGSMQF